MFTKRCFTFSILILSIASGGKLSAQIEANINSYGSPGLVELPYARRLADGALAFTINSTGENNRNTVTFQITERLSGSFRYAKIENFDGVGKDRFDRSFDLQYQIVDETVTIPSVALGFRDFLGSGIYAAEYLVATKSIQNGSSITAGIGWGRLASSNSFKNPLSYFIDDLTSRDPQNSSGGIGGQLESSDWFRGPTSIFLGLDLYLTENISAQLEYSSDGYLAEISQTDFRLASQFNAALSFTSDSGFSLKGYSIGGEDWGLQLGFIMNPKAPLILGGRDSFPTSFNRPTMEARSTTGKFYPRTTINTLSTQLEEEGIQVQGISMEDNKVILSIENSVWSNHAQAVGRASRVLANTLPPGIEEFSVVLQEHGVPITEVTTRRRDLEELQYHFDATWRTQSRSQLSDANYNGKGDATFSYDLKPYSAFSFFDPQSPIRADFGIELSLDYRARPGLTLDTQLRYPLAGNLGESDRESDSSIRHVRSDTNRYASESSFEINRLTAEYIWRPKENSFARVTAGYLENQYGGISAEILWFPLESRFALGAELNYVKQRDFDMLLGFQDYTVITGHTSAYYDLGNGFHTQIDLGRYLAGDWGGTLTVKREFNNGVKVGGYFTLTDVPFADFGEGSFDKGLSLEIPLSFFTGLRSRRVLNPTIQPLIRDGGARLNVQNRLYPFVRDYRGAELRDSWARYLR